MTRQQEQRERYERMIAAAQNHEANRAKYLEWKARKLPGLVELQDRMMAGEDGKAILAETARQVKNRPTAADYRQHTMTCVMNGTRCKPGEPCSG